MLSSVLWTALRTEPRVLTVPTTGAVYAAARPLVGGPAFLPLHVCVLHNGILYDFLPSRWTAEGFERASLPT